MTSANANNLNEKTNLVMQTLSNEIDDFLPTTTRRIQHRKLRREAWISNGLMKSMNKCRRLYRNQLKGSAKDREKYKEYNDILRKVKRHAKKQYYIDKCTEYKSNTKKLWQTINKISGKTNDKSCIISYIKDGNTTITDPTGISNHFGSYFSNVGKRFADKIPPASKPITDYLNMISMNKQSIFFEPTTPQEVMKLIKHLPNKKSSGYDQIDNILLKEISPVISDIRCDLFNESMALGIFPEHFKLAEVVPLHKGKSREIVNNYRPISLLTTISKILEKLVYK